MGPSILIFSILYQYSRIVPAAYKFRIFGIPLSNKNMPYLLALQVGARLLTNCFDSFGLISSQLAISRLPGSAAVAVIGILAGQLYRSDLANLKSYRISPSLVDFAIRYILPFLGNARPPQRSNRALPEDRPSSNRTNWPPPNEEVITTARTAPTGRHSEDEAPRRSSVVQQWVDELSGRAERESAVRVATEEQINTMVAMFPQVPREIIVNALQEK